MVEAHQNISITDLKAEAKRFRDQARRGGKEMSHSAALEHVAKSHGFRDWNTASAVLGQDAAKLYLGQRVSGQYLGHDFRGRLRGLQTVSPRETRVEIEFDNPIDVVRFTSFSSLRRRVRGVVRDDGKSFAKISTGDPHLVIDQMKPRSRSTRRGA